MESIGNSTSHKLLANTSIQYSIFKGTPIDTVPYSSVEVIITSDVSGTLRLEFSTDKINWDMSTDYPYNTTTVGSGMFISSGIKAKYYRTVYINGTTAQNYMRLQTLLHTTSSSTIPDPMKVYFDQPVTISGDVTIRNPTAGDIIEPATAYQTSDISSNTIISASPKILYNLNATNFAPDYRYLKLYDKQSLVTNGDIPLYTVPLASDLPACIDFPRGLKFTTGIVGRITRLLRATDTNYGDEEDVHLSITII